MTLSEGTIAPQTCVSKQQLAQEVPAVNCSVCTNRKSPSSGGMHKEFHLLHHGTTTSSHTSHTEDSTFFHDSPSYQELATSDAFDCWVNVVGKLYDREEQAKELQDAYLRRKGASSAEPAELVLITGKSGTGKSALAYSLRQAIEQDMGFFISGKFDQLRQPSRPFATLADAFRDLVQLIEMRDHASIQTLKEDVRAAVSSEAQLLAGTFPCLRELLDVPERRRISSSETSIDRKHIATVFRRFIKAIASPERPLVIFLDDLQWADTESLDFLEAIIQSSSSDDSQEHDSIPGLTVIGTARGNEVSYNSPLSVMLRGLEDSGACSITEIQIGNLGKSALGEMVSDLLRLPKEECESLTEIVYQRSNNGNAFHAMRYLESLQEDGYLVQEGETGIWSWNEERIARKSQESSYNVTIHSLAMLLEHKTKQMPDKTRHILKVASCIGGEFAVSILCRASDMSVSEGVEAFKVGVELGFVTWSNSETEVGRFVHDIFQEAAYSWIPDAQKPGFHLQIARNLGANLTPEEFDENLLLIVNLGIFGVEEVDAEECRQKLAELCLTAGKRAARSAAFATSLHYLETGIKMLTSNCWQDQYELSLALHTAATEMAYCMGDHEKVDIFAEKISLNARGLQDQLPAKNIQVMSWFSIERYDESIRLGFKVLKDLGEKFPKKVGTLGIVMDFMKTKRVLSGKSDSEILNLPPMTDARALGAMSMVHLLYGVLLRSRFELAPLVGFRMVRLSMHYGLSPMSSFGFGTYASIHSRMGMVEEAARYGHLALQILERFPSTSVASRTLCTVWADAMPEKIAFRKCLEPLKESVRFGMMAGDVNTALIAGFVRSAISFYVGEPLENVQRLVYRYSDISREYKHDFVIDFLNVLGQGCSNLQGHTAGNPLILSGARMEEDEMVKKTSAEKLATGYLWIFVMKYMLAAYMHDFDYAESFSRQIRKHMQVTIIPLIKTVHLFLEGFVAAARSTPSRRNRSIARSRLKELKRAAKNCPENLSNKVCLLQAEIARCSYLHEKALQKYDQAINLAAKDGCLHEQGLASERAGRMLIEFGNLKRGQVYLRSARALYAQWGGQIKVDQVDRILYNKE